MYLCSETDFEDKSEVVSQMRQLFAEVFANHYATLIKNALNQERSDVLNGFSDLEKKCFPNGFGQYTHDERLEVIHKLYLHAGFDDEAAFIMGDPENPDNKAYKILLEAEGRELLYVGFVCLFNKVGTLIGFAIYHLMRVANDDQQLIVHIRQAAMRYQNCGHASIIARLLIDKLLKQKITEVSYEANQRSVNDVPSKASFIEQGLLHKQPAVLGYNDRFYTGLYTTAPIATVLTKRYSKRLPLAENLKSVMEAEDIPSSSFFKPNIFIRNQEKMHNSAGILMSPCLSPSR